MITAEIVGEPCRINYDHDDDCRKAIGSPLAVWIGYRRHQVRFASGVPTTFSKTPGVERSFCADCGTSISYADDGLKDEIWLTNGFMDNPVRFEPRAHGYWCMKFPWFQLSDILPRYDTYTRQRDKAVGYPRDREINQL
ncbi:aldehyde-activating protein [Ensifer sp. Root31]|uniref:GFA family protein n=1 Tax=Ensifer TaxID=106591 RepID=UPI00070A3514|nr:GFA family protein [Ensifer sp. Root31]KQU96100.1 aldehyde-activating protein [Ensifer sp. Root31]